MPLTLHGLRAVIYPAPDLDAAKAWWTATLGLAPYFDQPFYVGYTVAGYELGLLPDADPGDGALTYWAVDDVSEAVRDAIASGASEHTPSAMSETASSPPPREACPATRSSSGRRDDGQSDRCPPPNRVVMSGTHFIALPHAATGPRHHFLLAETDVPA